MMTESEKEGKGEGAVQGGRKGSGGWKSNAKAGAFTFALPPFYLL